MFFIVQISYAMYCIHFPLMHYAAWLYVGKGFTAEALPMHMGFNWRSLPVWTMAPFMAVLVVISAVFHHGVELPGRRFINARLARQQ